MVHVASLYKHHASSSECFTLETKSDQVYISGVYFCNENSNLFDYGDILIFSFIVEEINLEILISASTAFIYNI